MPWTNRFCAAVYRDGMSIEQGTRIRLVHTDDLFTRLRPGDEGTVMGSRVEFGDVLMVDVSWDDGSSLRLISGKDRWEVIDPAEGSHS